MCVTFRNGAPAHPSHTRTIRVAGGFGPSRKLAVQMWWFSKKKKVCHLLLANRQEPNREQTSTSVSQHKKAAKACAAFDC